MKEPSDYTGVLLFDYRDPKKFPIKLTNDQKALLKAVSGVIPQAGTGAGGKNLQKDNQRLLSSLLLLLNLTVNNQQSVNKLYLFFRYWQMSKEGRLITVKGVYKYRYPTLKSPSIELVGMDNWRRVMCYMDSLLISLFYSSSSFDFLLDSYKDDNLSSELQEQVNELKIMLRFIINLIRGGEYIPASLMKQLCLVLNSLGCEIAMSHRQEDVLQLFEFLAECLSLPLLTIKLDIMHSGKLNINDDLRLIEERALLISIPSRRINMNEPPVIEEGTEGVAKSDEDSNCESSEPPIPLEDCLNTYFNNSITVRRHLERRRTSERSDFKVLDKDNKDELTQYEKMGIVTANGTDQIDEDEIYESIDGIKSSSSHLETVTTSTLELATQLSNSTVSAGNGNTMTSSVESPSAFEITMLTPTPTINKVSERIEASRTRSSTIVSALNNVQVSYPSKLTRRSSSVSNNEVALPAWMFLQLLPYYTDPKIKLKPQNHEELYRRISRSRTIESVDHFADYYLPTPSKFDSKFGDKRPIIPICLKRYLWDEHGHSHKLERKVIIPEVIKYPYFIAEDRSKPGFVDFKRSTDNIAPFGSFMLILESCICHRGKSVNSGHYVSLTRAKPFHKASKINPDEKQWILFNDLNDNAEKSTPISFNDAMNSEDPYLLFYKIVDLDDDSNPDYGESVTSYASGDETSTIKPPKGSKDKYWATDSEPSAPNSTALAARKGSVVSQISLLSLKSAQPPPSPPQVQQQQDMNASLPPPPQILISNANSEGSSNNTTITIAANPNSTASRTNNHMKHLGLTKAVSRSTSNSRTRSKQQSISGSLLPDEISPADANYIDISNLYYWYEIDEKTGDFYKPLDYKQLPSVGVPLPSINNYVSSNDGGFLEKMNSKLLNTIKKSSINSISSASHLQNNIAASSIIHLKSDINLSAESFVPEKPNTEIFTATASTTERPLSQYSKQSSTVSSLVQLQAVDATTSNASLPQHNSSLSTPALLSPQESRASPGTKIIRQKNLDLSQLPTKLSKTAGGNTVEAGNKTSAHVDKYGGTNVNSNNNVDSSHKKKPHTLKKLLRKILN